MKTTFILFRSIASVVSLLCTLSVSHAVVAPSATMVHPLLIGAQVPDATIQTAEGSAQFQEFIKGKPTIVVFYRGSWCPYCSAHLQELLDAEPKLIKLGYQIIAISPDSSSTEEMTKKEKNIGYTLISDSGLQAAEAFGVAFRLDEATIEKYRGYGIDLEKASGGENKDVLPVPSVFIINADGKVTFTYVDPNYQFRVPAKLLISAAESSLEFHLKARR